jgi:hypothetical protein
MRQLLLELGEIPGTEKIPGKIFLKNYLEFENRIKPAFRDTGETFSVDLGMGQDFSDYPTAGIKDGHMLWTNREMLQVFTGVVDRNIELIKSQIDAIKRRQIPLEVS